MQKRPRSGLPTRCFLLNTIFCGILLLFSLEAPFFVNATDGSDASDEDNNTNNANTEQPGQYEVQNEGNAESTIKIISNPHENITHQKRETCDKLSCVPKNNLQEKLVQAKYIIRHTNIATQRETLQNVTFVRYGTKASSSLQEDVENGETDNGDKSNLVPIYYFKQSSQITSDPLPFQLLLVDDIDDALFMVHVVPVNIYIASRDTWFPGYYWEPIVICGCGVSATLSADRIVNRDAYYTHVGWKFTSTSDHKSFFYALIVNIINDSTDHKGVYIGNITAPSWMIHEVVGNVM